GGGQVAELVGRVMRLVGVARKSFGEQALELQLHGCNGFRVEQLAQVLRAEQLRQQLAIEREGLRPAFRERRVAFVHELRDIREEQRRCEGRGTRRIYS